jgi:hypothetical protein
LTLDGFDCLATLEGRAGEGQVGAIALQWEAKDFRDWPGIESAQGSLDEDILILETDGAGLRVDLRPAARGFRESLPAIPFLGEAFEAAFRALAAAQRDRGCDLRIGVLLGGNDSPTAMGRALAKAAWVLGRSLVLAPLTLPLRETAPGEGRLARAVRGLVGLGCGLTPSGDDFLCGLLASLRCSGSLAPELSEAILAECGRTGEVSASCLRYAARGYFPRALHELAAAIARSDAREAARAVLGLCEAGHSSGADTASGFLFGLSVVMGPWRAAREIRAVDAVHRPTARDIFRFPVLS